MKNLKNTVLLFVLCLLFSALIFGFAKPESKKIKTDLMPMITKQNKAVECKDNDLECFIKAAKNCRAATLTNYAKAAVFDTEFSQTAFYEIKGGSREKCKFYIKILDWQVKKIELSEAEKEEIRKEFEKLREQTLKNGGTVTELSEESKKELEENRVMTEKRMKDAIGTDGTCTFKAARLADLFERWKNGEFSSNDFKGANCRGTYFSEANGFPKGF